MTRLTLLQDLLDTLLPALRNRARDGDSPASIERIARALETQGEPGATPQTLPVCTWFDQAAARETEADDLAAILVALRTLYPLMVWRRRSGGPTASAGFVDAHANAMLLGPGGIEHRHDIWIGVSLLAPHTRYPDHDHAPEETYLVLSPGDFRKEGSDWFTPGIGGSFFVPPGAVHAMRSGNEPLFALWSLWASDDRQPP